MRDLNNMEQTIYTNLAEALANLLAPMVEVALFKQQDELVCVFNRLTKDAVPLLMPNQVTKLLINKNQHAKALVAPLTQRYYLRLIADTALFESLQGFLQQYLITPSVKATETIHWQQVVDQLINKYLQEHQTTLAALNTREKRALILLLHDNDIFRYQDASKYLANKIQVSRATIYNYLNQASQFKALEVHQVDAFTDEPFSGNPAGVVLER
jgi:predicted transcriptional regulator YheO